MISQLTSEPFFITDGNNTSGLTMSMSKEQADDIYQEVCSQLLHLFQTAYSLSLHWALILQISYMSLSLPSWPYLHHSLRYSEIFSSSFLASVISKGVDVWRRVSFRWSSARGSGQRAARADHVLQVQYPSFARPSHGPHRLSRVPPDRHLPLAH